MSYYTGVYKLDKRWKRGNLIIGDDELPKKLSFDNIADILVKSQKICFKDDELEKNKSRIMGLLNSKCDEYPTIAVVLSINMDEGNVFNDIGSLTIQKLPLNKISELFEINTQSYWIHEVCRSKINPDKIQGRVSPVKNAIEMAFEYMRKIGENKIYLLVEKYPEHGSGEFLVKYYNEKYGFNIVQEDEKYWYMVKDIMTRGGKRKKRKTKNKRRKKNKRTIKNKRTRCI